jgi:chemotaxis protein MotB
LTPKTSPRAGHDRWLMSYADLVTLLLALFTTLYAASTLDTQKIAPLSYSLRQAFDAPPMTTTKAQETAIVPPVTIVANRVVGEGLPERLARDLAESLKLERVAIRRDGRGLIVSLPEEAAFAVGSADMSAEARQTVDRIAAAVRPTPNGIRIEGHTDDVPIRTAKFASNWELSTARASAVVAYLAGSGGLAPARLSAAGYGEYHPRVPNDSAENRAKNRRIDIVILEGNPR